ncbi:MAG: response regulator [Candidatus Omnitrophica bacterium]|nr:response regulator [Candidatus Omnitrophota bacterium]
MSDMPQKNQLRLLFIEPEDYLFTAAAGLEKDFLPAGIQTASAHTLLAALQALDEQNWDLIFVGLYLPDSSGLETLDAIRKKSGCPLVAVLDKDVPGLFEKVIASGAIDCIVQPEGEEAVRNLRRFLRFAADKKHLQEALSEEKAEMSQLISSVTSILIRLNADGIITFWNSVAQKTFGVHSSDMLQKRLADCRLEWDTAPLLAAVEECRKKKQLVRTPDLFYKRPNGYEGFAGFSVIPIFKRGGLDTDIILFGADITEKRKLERMKDEFVSTVSHELRTPMTIIRESVSQVQDGVLGPVNDDQKMFLSISIEAIDRLTNIVNALLDVSKIEAGKMDFKKEKDDLAAVARKTVESFLLLAQNKGIELKTAFSHETVEIEIDKGKLIQIFTNLINNALKFTEKGHIEVSVQDEGVYVECRVNDTGRGIAEHDLPKVFGKFQQFEREHGGGEKGTGLGLAICKRLVEMHGGKIWVESVYRKGTSFVFQIPKNTDYSAAF